jgi:hypothetical protein
MTEVKNERNVKEKEGNNRMNKKRIMKGKKMPTNMESGDEKQLYLIFEMGSKPKLDECKQRMLD